MQAVRIVSSDETVAAPGKCGETSAASPNKDRQYIPRPGGGIEDGEAELCVARSLIQAAATMADDLTDRIGIDEWTKKRLWALEDVLRVAEDRLTAAHEQIASGHSELLRQPRGNA